MTINVEYLEEPKLQFGDYFEHEDTKTGLAEFGPFGKNIAGLHPSEIKLGFIGTRESISGAQEWVNRCASFIESENVEVVDKQAPVEGGLFENGSFADIPVLKRLRKIINRDFVGFNRDSSFKSCFQVNPFWERHIDPRELSPILAIDDKAERIWALVDLIEDRIAGITQTDPMPDIIVIALTPEIEERADTVRISGNFFLNLRRAIKARAMRQKSPIPVQLIRRGTVQGKGQLQEIATRGWNFCTAQYYKAGGVPWRPVTLEQDTCYVGISFYVAQDIDSSLTMRSSVAQAFDYLGQGLVLRGDQFEWDADALGASPHLTQEAACKLIQRTLAEYIKIRNVPPRRVVIHKTSEFWGKERGDYNELDGFYEGIDSVYPRCETDFVALRQTGIRLFREGMYPPLRGTYFSIEGSQHFLYTMGFIPYLETYPKSYVPEPWQIIQHLGGSAPKDIFREVLALTKMNVNNCAFADGAPITITFSQKVGEIMKHIPEDGIIQSQYKFYM
ncbi:MAG: hypothetical protein JW850_12430 [Thermoflexales bacterium]|nr:hypothetical protein [Thermoflexales bacterium]